MVFFHFRTIKFLPYTVPATHCYNYVCCFPPGPVAPQEAVNSAGDERPAPPPRPPVLSEAQLEQLVSEGPDAPDTHKKSIP